MKNIKIVGVFVIFILSIIFHFMYNLFPNILFSILFPVNESIWEHMKLIATSTLVFSIFEYIMYKRNNIYFNNFIFANAISIIIGIFIYLIIYIPIDNIFGHSTFIAIFLLFIIFIIIQIISYYIMNTNKIKYSNVIGIVLILIIYFIFGYLTYHPIHISLFYDYMNNHYGIKKVF